MSMLPPTATSSGPQSTSPSPTATTVPSTAPSTKPLIAALLRIRSKARGLDAIAVEHGEKERPNGVRQAVYLGQSMAYDEMDAILRDELLNAGATVEEMVESIRRKA